MAGTLWAGDFALAMDLSPWLDDTSLPCLKPERELLTWFSDFFWKVAPLCTPCLSDVDTVNPSLSTRVTALTSAGRATGVQLASPWLGEGFALLVQMCLCNVSPVWPAAPVK